jgi:hypothetical protein
VSDAELEVLFWAEVETKAAVYPNPPCLPWCRWPHGRTEFAVNGGIICTAEVAREDGWAVYVEGGQWAELGDEDLSSPLDKLHLTVRISDGATHRQEQALESLPVDQLPALQRGLMRASAFVDKECR